MEGCFVWCGTLTRAEDGVYYLYFSFWPKESGFNGWLTHSKIGYATSPDPLGKFVYRGIAIEGSGSGWDADNVHNPSVICHEGKYYLYYMGNFGDGSFWII